MQVDSLQQKAPELWAAGAWRVLLFAANWLNLSQGCQKRLERFVDLQIPSVSPDVFRNKTGDSVGLVTTPPTEVGGFSGKPD